MPLVVLAGPTAVGKSKLAVDLALQLNGEVVTADSMQVYRGLDISTDKPGPEEMRGVPHHMIDVKSPDEPFNAVDYRDMARRVIHEIHQRGNLPILAGGTGLYIKGVLEDFTFPANKANPALRQKLEEQAAIHGPQSLHDRLRSIDPASAERLHPNDVRRVIRAIEIYEMTGKSLSHHLADRKPISPRYRTAMIALTRDRDKLYQRIEERVDEQIRRGLVEEVRRLKETYAELPMAAQALGVKEMLAYLSGEMNLDEAISILKRNTRRYAKRQLTWFRHDPRFTWFNLDELTYSEAVSAIVRHIRQQLMR